MVSIPKTLLAEGFSGVDTGTRPRSSRFAKIMDGEIAQNTVPAWLVQTGTFFGNPGATRSPAARYGEWCPFLSR